MNSEEEREKIIQTALKRERDRYNLYKEGMERGTITEREGQLMGYATMSQNPLVALELYENDPVKMLEQLDIRLEHWEKIKRDRPRGKNRSSEMLLTRRDAKVTRMFKDAIQKAEEAVKTLKKRKKKKKKKKKETKKKKIERMLLGKTPPGGWDEDGVLTPHDIMITSRWGGKSKKKRKKRRRRRKTRKIKKRKKRN